MPKFLIVILIVFTFTFNACAKNEGITYTAPELEGSWSVDMTMSGGIAGLMRSIEVGSDGSYQVSDNVMKNIVKGKLSKDELTRLTGLITSLEFNASGTESGCADCFLYQIEIESGGRKIIVEADDVTLGNSGIGELTEFLRGIMDMALK